ncbi:hypothetical protein A2833_01070 [Candidatus Azambacteria bacterium RIFCSPHIGHO2_01_FULL_44_55]|uniref:Plasmid stabilization protein n=1 Tax=Candidatus Azambacteria bacterium RIFCSPLOWO2_02_FULL_44_14 TaxID=1797306 RepID=A0A1F5CAK0_9BACT|nr:MAG: hypothetical protein A3A18_00885 [Candidatus Azambacteria bacterium RIFCSPLOWO2_01_FULL_44_84]OGD33649.1 MAG: hypothetical protein A3C78_03335 [Candidatus Azambacteria bacterium RIFCSPHIGHO2_02_FULL_45_18]OGD39848.1 MAG: hypothetical protein A3I30_00360 [Candidatus Azambacteria bacterium RIFCSPLOWO2_02_FULL_44_14]OGD41809.1 MAG: hypothetical protein A2833_01070 [Candidatus Azambacteria bacterium RIFCSPHIGHO2_01_FULL_44_55]OGD52031.1 MAG: hypothetical protein A2608_00025 [Candidatus Azam
MNLSKSWDLQINPSVFKALKRIPRPDAENFLVAIHLLLENPYFGDVQKMKGESNTWRRRIGSYRIFYRLMIAERVILVFHLERRTSKTY